jgi:hypothetical protein
VVGNALGELGDSSVGERASVVAQAIAFIKTSLESLHRPPDWVWTVRFLFT